MSFFEQKYSKENIWKLAGAMVAPLGSLELTQSHEDLSLCHHQAAEMSCSPL